MIECSSILLPTHAGPQSSRIKRLTMAKLQREDEEGEFRENIPSEVEDRESSPVSFDIVTYPADFTLLGLYEKIDSKEIVIPKFQRKFVWKQKQSSRLIESFLLGIPVPPIFLFTRQ